MNFTSNPVVDALHDAGAAAEKLHAMHVHIVSAYANGRRPVLVIDHPPAFVNGVEKRRSPNGRGGIERVMASSYHGVQLEWVEHLPAKQEAANG